jgi:hypothetical protein
VARTICLLFSLAVGIGPTLPTLSVAQELDFALSQIQFSSQINLDLIISPDGSSISAKSKLAVKNAANLVKALTLKFNEEPSCNGELSYQLTLSNVVITKNLGSPLFVQADVKVISCISSWLPIGNFNVAVPCGIADSRDKIQILTGEPSITRQSPIIQAISLVSESYIRDKVARHIKKQIDWLNGVINSATPIIAASQNLRKIQYSAGLIDVSGNDLTIELTMSGHLANPRIGRAPRAR